MNVITKRTIVYYMEKYPAGKVGLLTWLKEFGEANFTSPNELKNVYKNASIIANHRVIFNIKRNDFRLITSINYRTQAAYIIWFGTHKEYDKIDAASVRHITV